MDKLEKVHGALGLARKAGKCIAGDFAVERAIKAGKTRFVVLDCTASDATRNRYKNMCAYAGCAYLEMDGMGVAIGKPNGKIAAIADEGFAKMIANAMEEYNATRG